MTDETTLRELLKQTQSPAKATHWTLANQQPRLLRDIADIYDAHGPQPLAAPILDCIDAALAATNARRAADEAAKRAAFAEKTAYAMAAQAVAAQLKEAAA